jgi:hypothetical protein
LLFLGLGVFVSSMDDLDAGIMRWGRMMCRTAGDESAEPGGHVLHQEIEKERGSMSGRARNQD